MFSNITTAQLCGFLFLFILITSALSQALATSSLDPADVPGSLNDVAENDKKFRLGIVIDLISHISIVALAAMLYLVFSPFNQTLALIGTLLRVAEGAILALNEISNLVFLEVSQKFVSATGAQAIALESMGRMLISTERSGMKIGLLFLLLGMLMYSILFVSSGAIPLVLGWSGVIACILAVVGVMLTLINPNISMVSFAPYILYEVVLGFWLLLRGGQISSPG
jgi:hypothetical protein